MINSQQPKNSIIETSAEKMTKWIGSPSSIIVHTFLFVVIFGLRLFQISVEEILLILTTLVSLEAIYLSIFIQMTVNKQAESLKAVHANVEELNEDVDEIAEDIDEISEDIDDISEDIDEISEDIDDLQEDLPKKKNGLKNSNKKILNKNSLKKSKSLSK